MEKFESKIDSLVFAIFVTFCLLDIAAFVIWVVFGIWWPTLVLVTITVLFIIPPYFFTWYKLTDDSLKITFGYFMVNRTIPYDSILSVRPVVGHSMAPALSSRRIEIIYYKNNRSRRVCISPGMYSTFLNIITDRALESAVAKSSPSQEERFERPAKPVTPSKLTAKKPSPAKAKKAAPKKTAQTKTVKKPAPKVAVKKTSTSVKIKESEKKQSVKPAVKKVAATKSEVVKKPAPAKDSTTEKVTAAKTSTAKKPAMKKISTAKKTAASKKTAAAKKPTSTKKKTS